MLNFYCLILLLLLTSTSDADPTLVITGSWQQNPSKIEFLRRYIPDSVVKNIHSSESNIVIYNRNDALDADLPQAEQISGVTFYGNLSTVVLTKKPFEDLNSEELKHLERILRTERALYIIEFGKNSHKPIWMNYADCWATSTTDSESDNTVYFCNKEMSAIPFAMTSEKIPTVKPTTPIVSSFFFVSASNNKYRVDKKKMEQELEDEIQDIVEETMKVVEKRKKDDDDVDDEDGNGSEFDNKHDPKRDHRLHCKYRKSCYESGKRGLIEPFDLSFDHIFHFWRAPTSQQHSLPKTEDADQDGILDSEDEDVNLADRKLVCKYRTACYKEHNIPLSDKQQERERSFMTAKLQAPQGKKRTLKDIAAKAISGVKEKEQEAKSRPVPKSLIVEKKLQEIENQLQKKLDCKYRKSCYETGELPEIEESSFSIPFLSLTESKETDSDDEQDDEKTFEEMEDLEKKHHCKYRKSCYKTGVKPEIESEMSIESFRDILEIPDVVETRKLTVQERCKYRKSCYETGILPDLSQDDEHIEKAIKKEVSKVIPSTVQDLKTLCKYRKSCYQEISETPTADIIHTIRKRRVIEKEVRKRRTRRHRRLHKRRAMMNRYGMTTESGTKYDKVEKTQKELQDIAEARESRRDAPTPKSVKIQRKKKTPTIVEEVETKTIVASETAEPVDNDANEEEETNDSESVKKSVKHSKRNQDPEPETMAEDPEPVKKPKSLKKSKRKQAKNGPEVEEEDEPELTPMKKLKTSKKVKEERKQDNVEEQPETIQESIHSSVPLSAHEKKSEISSHKRQESDPEDEMTQDVPQNDEKERDFQESNAIVEEDDKENEFDNVHDPKRDHRLHCKYRKTCYETGKRGLIEPYDFSLWHIVHFWAAPASQQHHNYGKYKDSDGDGVPDLEDKDAAMADRKLSCKYRASCYNKYNIPMDDKVVKREQMKSEKKDHDQDQDDEYDDDDRSIKTIDLDAADRRLECKYRRSCYDSGVLPTIQQWSEAPTLSETIESSSKNMKMTKCKYRKSCYEAAGISDKEAEDGEDDEKIKNQRLKETLKPVGQTPDRQQHSKHGKKKHQEPKDSNDDDDDDDSQEDDQDEKPKKSKEDKKEESKIHKQTDKETLEQDEKDLHLTVAEKSWCKYRKSCYSSVEPKAAKQDHSGAMARRAGSGQKCHIYYLSCREAMGLPPKEKAPIGPNGKRLCRKVKKDI